MEASTRTDIILAAIHATPPVTEPLRNKENNIVATEQEVWQAQVADKARSIAVMVGERSAISHELDVISWAGDKDNDKAKVVIGTILSIKAERKSTRGLVTLKTKVHERWAPDGTEVARTERTDTAGGLLMAQRIRTELMGHRVMCFIEMQETPDQTKVRVIKHIEDLGLDESAVGDD